MWWCMRCGKPMSGQFGWCPPCHKIVVKEINDRKAIPPGGMSYQEAKVNVKPGRYFPAWGREVWEAAHMIIDFMKRSIHTKGCGFYAIDDMSPWSEIALRNWEDSGSEL